MSSITGRKSGVQRATENARRHLAAPAPGPTFDPGSVGRNVEEFQGYAREGVEASARLMRPEMMRDIGTTLGGLNSIGALRSGGTTVALRDLDQRFTDRVADHASRSTMDAIDRGTSTAFGTFDRQRGVYEADREHARQEQARKDAKKASWMSALGSVLGAGAGFLVGGPAGAALGAGVVKKTVGK